MWIDTLNSAGGLITALATLVTALGGAVLVVKNISKNETTQTEEIVQGQVITPQDMWLQGLKEDADEADTLRDLLMLAITRLAEAGLPYKDLLPHPSKNPTKEEDDAI